MSPILCMKKQKQVSGWEQVAEHDDEQEVPPITTPYEHPQQDLKNVHQAPCASPSMVFPIPIYESHGYLGFKLDFWCSMTYFWLDKAFAWPLHDPQINL